MPPSTRQGCLPPLAIDLCCGAGGWTDGFLANGFDVVGFDIHRYREYRGGFVLQDVRTLVGRQFSNAAIIVASPPCQEFSQARVPKIENPDLSIVQACIRIAGEAGVPFILENVRGAIPFLKPMLGIWKHRYASFYLWGDVPVLMPAESRLSAIKARHRSPVLRSRIPFELAFWVAEVFKNRVSLGNNANNLSACVGQRVTI